MVIKKMIEVTATLLWIGMLTGAVSGAGQTINVPQRPVPPSATVAIVRDNSVDYAAMVAEALESALGPGGISNLVHSGQTVVIKPNLVSNTTKAVTDWRMVQALVNEIKSVNGGAAITIAEGSATNNETSSTSIIMAAQGFTAANFPGVTLVDINNLNQCPTNYFILADGASDNTTKQVAARIYEADVFINCPKMKTHYHAGMTGATKNIGIGVPSWSIWNNPGSNNNKGGLHNDIRREILDHILCRVPDLTLMDGIQAMEGQGPVQGDPVTMNLMLAGRDPIALDAVACEIMDIPAYLITHLVLAANENVGIIDLNHITVTGNVSIADVKRHFLRATPGGLTPPYELATIPYRATTVIRTAPSGGVTIDGDLGEWGHANTIDINAADQVKSGNSWNGPKDCSMTGLFMYDAANLYFAAHVRDTTRLTNSATGSAIRNGECIELYLSTYSPQYDANHGTSYMGQYDHVLGISYNDNPAAYMFSHNQPVTGFSARKVETGDGYLIETKIPWSNFNSYSQGRYRQIGINVGICDADVSPTSVTRKMYWNAADQSDVESNPQKLGMSYLDPAGGIYAVPSCSLTVNAEHGTVQKVPEDETYDAFSLVTVTITPEDGYGFAGWSDGVSDNPRTVFMRCKTELTALFNDAPVLTSITVSPLNASVYTGESQQFTATAYDQFTMPLSPQPDFTWSVSGEGTVTAEGFYTAAMVPGSAIVTAASGAVSGSATVVVDAEPTVVYQINTGSDNAAAPFSGDQYGSGGTLRTVTNTIDMSEVNGNDPAPQTVYRSERYGNSSYTIPNLTPSADYTVRLHFAELYQTSTGARLFDVEINNVTVLDNFDIYAETGARYKAVIQEFTATANGSGEIIIDFITVADNATIEGIEIIAATPEIPPTIVTAASAHPDPVTAAATDLSVLGDDDAGESSLTYTWAAAGTPPAPVNFSANGTNGAKNCTATFTEAGTYSFEVTVSDIDGLSATSSVNVTVEQTPTSVTVTPSTAVVILPNTGLFSALVNDQFGNALTVQPTIIWSVDGNCTIDGNGLLTPGSTDETVTVTATGGSLTGTASVTVVFPPSPPVIVTPASAVPNPVTGTTAALSVLGEDDDGEAGLIYTWATAGTPPAPVSFSSNGSNSAKNCTATFSEAGDYTMEVTVEDAGGLSVTSMVTVGVEQTITAVTVSPSSVTLDIGTQRQFTANATDQFGDNLSSQPAFTWGSVGSGSVSASGLYTAGSSAGNATVSAEISGITGNASVTIVAEPEIVYQINTGSDNAVSPYSGDQYGSGGTLRTVTNTIDMSEVNGNDPAPQTVYRSERYGNSTYAIPGLTPLAGYTVRLHFAELYQTATGKRRFHVDINDVRVLTNFDIYAETGARYKAMIREFDATADDAGEIGIEFITVTDNATIEGIEIIRTIPGVPPTVVNAASATPNPVTGTSTDLSVLADDDSGEENLTYTWAATGTPPAPVTFSSNGTNDAKNSTVTFAAAGDYTFEVTIEDAEGLSTTGNVAVTVDQTISSVAVSPAAAEVDITETQQFTATASDQFGNAFTVAHAFTWSVSGDGSIAADGLYTAGSVEETATVTAQSGTVSGEAIVTVDIPNTPPTITTAASVAENPVAGTTAALSVLGDDDDGEPDLIYIWATTGTPPAMVSFSTNGTNNAKNVTATFSEAGDYSFEVTIEDAEGLSVTSPVDVTVSQTVSSITVNPATVSIDINATQQFNANATDQFGNAMNPQPSFTWSVDGSCSIDASGLLTAGAIEENVTVTSTVGSVNGTASVTVTEVNTPPTVVNPASAGPSPVTGTFTDLSVLGNDNGGEANLMYTWSTTGTPPASVSFSANGTNDAKSSTVTFTKAGDYTFEVTIEDAEGLSVTSSVSVTVVQTAASVAVSPATVTLNISTTQQFTATAIDQFGDAIVSSGFTWSSSGAGSIDGNGLFSAGSSAGSATVTAQTGAVSGSAGVTILAEPEVVYQINTGNGGAAAPFSADQFGSGGNTYNVSNSIDMSLVNGNDPAPQAVYQSERYGNSTYTIPNLLPLSEYTVRLHFTELYWTSSGDRIFDVTINGVTVLDNFDIFAETGARYKATIREFTTSADGAGEIEIQFITGTDNATVQGIEVISAIPDNPPVIVQEPSANPVTVTGTTTSLSVLGDDDHGESNLIYTWTGAPSSVSFSPNGTNDAKNTTAAFTEAGVYSITVTVTDAGNKNVTGTITGITVVQTMTRIDVSPANVTLNVSETQQFAATAFDQFDNAMTSQPSFTWSNDGSGTIDGNGLYTAGTNEETETVTVSSEGYNAYATVTVSDEPQVVYQISTGSNNAVSPFSGDQYGSGGTMRTVSNTINMSGVTGNDPAPQTVYKSERYGNSTYTIPGLTANAVYTVRLHFAELYQTQTGVRLFDVQINNVTVLDNFDIYAETGARYKATIRQFTATANSSGQIIIRFITVNDNATIEGIEIIQ